MGLIASRIHPRCSSTTHGLRFGNATSYLVRSCSYLLTACKRGDLQSIKVLYMVVVWCVNDILHGQHRENARRTAESVTQDAMSRPSGFFGLIIVIGPYRSEISNINIVSISYRISNVFSTVSYRIDFQFDIQH